MKLRKYESSRMNMNRLEMNQNKSEYFIIGELTCANGLNGL